VHRRNPLFALAPILLVLAAYVWFVSTGTWTRWPTASTYYNQLASAFAQGHLWLDLKPNPEVLALANPYDPEMRTGVTYLSDASLYQGKYYLYFGPVPALLVLPVKALFASVVPDQYLVFAFTCGTLIVMSLFLLSMWRRFLPDLPPWMVGFGILGIGLASPFGWVLGSRASVHDVAISAGQFFFLGGLYAAFGALEGAAISKPKSAIAGILWAAALGSRITQIIPVAFMVTMVLTCGLRHRRRYSNPQDVVWSILAVIGPLILGMAALGWYNWARFGSVLETGITYQLALLNLQKYRQDIFSVKYVLQNLYNYLLMLPKLRYNFPYIWPRMGIRTPIAGALGLPSLYFAEEITGLVYTNPFLLFAVLAAFVGRRDSAGSEHDVSGPALARWLSAALGGSFLLGFATFLVFFWASERYLLDFLPAALLLALFGFWSRIQALRQRSLPWAVTAFVGMALLLISTVVSSLLAIAQNAEALRQLNPILWQQLNNLFRP
jgi:hypothetical protein